jgi:hypothetical protein
LDIGVRLTEYPSSGFGRPNPAVPETALQGRIPVLQNRRSSAWLSYNRRGRQIPLIFGLFALQRIRCLRLSLCKGAFRLGEPQRTREIGLRLALGATPTTIPEQAIVLTNSNRPAMMVAAWALKKDHGSTPLGRLCNFRLPGRAAISKSKDSIA